MKLLFFVLVSEFIAQQEAASLAHPNSPHNVMSVAARKDLQESETNMTVEQALRALPPVPHVLKAFLVMRLGQNVSNLIRIDDNHTGGTHSLRGSRKKLSLIHVESYRGRADQLSHGNQAPVHELEGSSGAATMLNRLLTENQEKMDAEHARCRNFKIRQRREITETNLAMSEFNANSDKAHGEWENARGRLFTTGTQLPKLREGLHRHVTQCQTSQNLLQQELELHESEETKMEAIVELAECTQSTTLIQCPSKRRGKHHASYFSFGTLAPKQAAARLKLAATRQAVQEVLKDAYGTAIDMKEDAMTTPNSSSPLPNPNSSAPLPNPKEKCTLRDNPNCPNLADKLMFMLSDISDRVSQIKREQLRMEANCKSIQENLKDQIGDLVKIQTDATADFAFAAQTKRENQLAAGEKQVQFDQLTNELAHEMSTCRTNQENLYSEECSIKLIRFHLYQLASMSKVLRDCQVSQWEVIQPCSATCGTGTMRRNRRIELPPLDGAACPPLVEEIECEIPTGCPVPCRLGTWSGWSECSSGCGGGVKERSRVIEQHPVNGGDPCDITSQSEPCNLQACNVPCVLKPWTSWSKCSKHCGAGHRTRFRSIEHDAVGQGHCPSVHSPERHWTLPCNTQPCVPDGLELGLRCTSKLDLVLMLDGSGSMGAQGFGHVKKAAEHLIDALHMDRLYVELSVLLFSGPRTWSEMDECYSGQVTDLRQCGMTWVTGNNGLSKWTVDKADVIQRIQNLQWPQGGTLTGMALGEAKTAIIGSRKDAPSTVVVITDGKPSYHSRAVAAASSIRMTARLMWVPVGPSVKFSDFVDMASHPVEENIVPNLKHAPFSNLHDLEMPSFQNLVLENLCPDLQGIPQ